MRKTALRRGRPLTRSTPLPAVSAKQAGHLRTYRVLRRAYLADRTRCEFPGCTRPATEIHHRKGRVGVLLLDVAHWSALCTPCHRRATVSPAEAYALGVSERRIGGAA